MSEYKEFTGKNLDEAIKEACDHYGLERGRLELEILSGGSSGIFGLVGKKKAVVRARPLDAGNFAADSGRERRREPRPPRQPVPVAAEPAPAPAVAPNVDAEAPVIARPSTSSSPLLRPDYDVSTDDFVDEFESGTHREVAAGYDAGEYEPGGDADDEHLESGWAGSTADVAPDLAPGLAPGLAMEDVPAEEELPLDDPELEAFIIRAAGLLVEPIIGQAGITARRTTDRIRAYVSTDEDPGLLIGRDGQTLSAIQYLLNRMVAKRWPEAPRVQIDTGDYRERQDDKLRKLALVLASKAMTSGKVQSTKPLSSYHRRVVHLALQNGPNVTTKSKGDGPLKRVLVIPRRSREA